MNTQETASVMSLLKMSYPGHFRAMSNEEFNSLLKFWSKELKKYSYETVFNAVSTVVKRSEYCPAISHILEQLRIDTRSIGEVNNCDICGGSGLIAYTKKHDYQGKIGIQEINYCCACSCNQTNKIPSYEQIFGFEPLPPQQQQKQQSKNVISFGEAISQNLNIIKGKQVAI